MRTIVFGVLLGASGCVRTPGAELRERVAVVERAKDPSVLLRKAKAFASIGDFARAEQYFQLAAENGGDPEQLLPRVIEMCVRDQRYRDAVQHVDGYLRKHPNAHQLRFVLASLEAAVGNTQRARSEYERVLLREPDNAEVHFALAVLLRDGLENLEPADRHFRSYLRLRPDGVHAEEARAALLVEVP